MILLMAWRNIWRNKMRSVIIMLSVAFGLLAGIAVLALYKGMLHSRVHVLIYDEVSHIQVHDTSFKKDFEPVYTISNYSNITQALHADPRVKSIALRSITTGMLTSTSGSAGIQINGIEWDAENAVSGLQRKIVQGKGLDAAPKNGLMIGKKLADKMKLNTGTKVVLTFTDSSGSMVSGAFKVGAIYQSSNSQLGERNVYIKKQTLNELLNIGDNSHEIAVILYRDEDAPGVKQTLATRFPGYQIETWKELSPETELMTNTVDIYSYIIIVIIMFALAFGIVNTMLMAILERTREIGMMIALGMSRAKIFSLILLETLLLTITGTPIGLAIAWGLIFYFNRQGLDLSGMGKEMMRNFGYETLIYPEFPADKIIPILLIVVGTALVSCLLPAIRAVKLEPVKALNRFG